MKITIGTPKISDVPTMVAWGKSNHELWASDRESWYPKKTIEGWIKDPQRDIILVAKDGKTLVGMCLVHGMRDWSYCSSLFVSKDYRGQGIGKALLAQAVRLLKKRGYGMIAVLAEADNKEAQEFYTHEGFKKGFVFQWMDKRIK